MVTEMGATYKQREVEAVVGGGRAGGALTWLRKVGLKGEQWEGSLCTKICCRLHLATGHQWLNELLKSYSEMGREEDAAGCPV